MDTNLAKFESALKRYQAFTETEMSQKVTAISPAFTQLADHWEMGHQVAKHRSDALLWFAVAVLAVAFVVATYAW